MAMADGQNDVAYPGFWDIKLEEIIFIALRNFP
jgi:hypothetical protein